MASIVLGVFSQRGNAEDAISELEARGYNPKDMSILMRDTSKNTGNIVGDAVGGAAAGAVIGGIAGLVAIIIPGIGAFFIGGPIASALGLTGTVATTASGAATGAVAGGILGALGSVFGLSMEEARLYEDRIKEGGILVAVPTSIGGEQEVEEVMDDLEADNIKTVESHETQREETGNQYSTIQLNEIKKPRSPRK